MDRLTHVLYTVASQIGRTDDPHTAMAAILGACVAHFGAHAGCIALANPDTQLLQIEAQTGLPDDVREHALRPGQGLTGWAAFHGKTVLAPDVRLDPRYIAVRATVLCEMAAPLEAGGQILGAISLAADHVGAFNHRHAEQLTAVAGEAALTLSRIWMERQLQAKARQLETLTSIGQSLVAKTEVQELLDTITRETRAISGGRICSIVLVDAATGQLRAESWAGPEGFQPPVRESWRPEDCLAGTVVRTLKQAEFANLHTGEFLELRDVPHVPPVRSALLSPLVAEGRVIGVLASYSERPHRHNNDEKRLHATLANLGTVAIENARLYARVFQSEDTLRKNETLNTLGLLAAEIAHEIRNPLTVIKLLYSSLGLEFAADDPRAKDTRIIAEKLNQLEAIVSRVLNFAKAPSALHSRWSLDEIISDTVLLVRLKLHQSKIRIVYEPPAAPLLVDANKGQLQQVLLNLILNSTHAMPQGGTITLVTAREDRPGGPCAHLDVIDTGCGIPVEIQGRIFDSFLSTRPDGTGLGLAIVKRIVQGHRGDIQLVATSGTGTTLRITLPLAGS